MPLIIAGNAERNFHQKFLQYIRVIMNFNVDGLNGKKRLRDFANVFSTIIGTKLFLLRLFINYITL